MVKSNSIQVQLHNEVSLIMHLIKLNPDWKNSVNLSQIIQSVHAISPSIRQ